MEYVLAMYVFLEFIYFDLILVFLNKHIKHKYAGRVVQILVFAFLFLISMSLKLFLHFLAGVIW